MEQPATSCQRLQPCLSDISLHGVLVGRHTVMMPETFSSAGRILRNNRIQQDSGWNSHFMADSIVGIAQPAIRGHVFISYAREDSAEVDLLQRTLEAVVPQPP